MFGVLQTCGLPLNAADRRPLMLTRFRPSHAFHERTACVQLRKVTFGKRAHSGLPRSQHLTQTREYPRFKASATAFDERMHGKWGGVEIWWLSTVGQ